MIGTLSMDRETWALGVQVVVEIREEYEILWKNAEQRQQLGQNSLQFTHHARLCSLPPPWPTQDPRLISKWGTIMKLESLHYLI